MRFFTSQRPGLWILIVSCFFSFLLVFLFFCTVCGWCFFLVLLLVFSVYHALFDVLLHFSNPGFSILRLWVVVQAQTHECQMPIFLLFSWLQKMHISYFVDFVEIAACILQKVEYAWICIFRWKKHISGKYWSHQKCIIPWEPWSLDKINELWNMHFSAASRKVSKKKYIFPWNNAYFGKSWSHQTCTLKIHIFSVLSKIRIENAYFLPAIFTASQKCITDSGTPTFLICAVSPKAVWRWSFDLCILNFQHARHDAKTFWIPKLPRNIIQTSQSLDWHDVIETRFPFFDLVLTRN